MGKAELVSGDVDFGELAKLTEPRGGRWYSSSDIEQIVNEAKMAAFLRAVKTGRESPITMDDLREAVRRVPPSIPEDMLRRYEEWAKATSV